MTEHVKQKHLLEIDRSHRAWTVTFDANSVSPNGKRGDLAQNMVAQVAVGNEQVRNDFDRVSIFQRPIFNATWDNAAGRWVDFVQRGEKGFTFSPTEPNREVVYRCRPFWYKIGFEGLYGPTYVSVTDRPLEGYQLAPMFRDGETFEYRPCFELTLGTDGLPHSRAGFIPFESDPVHLMDKVLTYDGAARTENMADWFSDYLLLLVEFGTRNLQGFMRGAARGALDATAILDEEDPDVELGIYTVEPQTYTVGKTYRFVYVQNGTRVVHDVELLEIGEENEYAGFPLYFDFSDQTAFIQAHDTFEVFEKPKPAGEALLSVQSASSGRANEDLYSACVWRGKENPWGNFSSLISDVLFEAMGQGGVVVPYTLEDIRQFNGDINSAYTKRSYTTRSLMESESSYIVSFTPCEPSHFLIPADFYEFNPTYHHAALFSIVPNDTSKGVRYLRVGGDYTTPVATNHATYEMVASSPDLPKFGGRLILQEGLW